MLGPRSGFVIVNRTSGVHQTQVGIAIIQHASTNGAEISRMRNPHQNDDKFDLAFWKLKG
jgi:hypothetical protein